ncbi:GNAT family N-acetyltransferase [Psychromonas sp. B3M02]|uniref:GNAT family N-acetyltransferase n=1 Tax=Psychromonas sp. B3M02 TaxID=2267226 RepID=UPI001C691EC6|nr:GNAT family N-acetyltransferase [Psychromonas sp. B3M02]
MIKMLAADKPYRIVTYCCDYAVEVTDIFYAAVHSIDPKVYSLAQQSAWATLPINYRQWAKRLSVKKPFLLLIEEQVVGFMELDDDGHIDCAYVHPHFQQQGVGSLLLTYIINHAQGMGLPVLYVEASMLAKPLFEKFGFKIVRQQTAWRNGLAFVQYVMQRNISFKVKKGKYNA